MLVVMILLFFYNVSINVFIVSINGVFVKVSFIECLRMNDESDVLIKLVILKFNSISVKLFMLNFVRFIYIGWIYVKKVNCLVKDMKMVIIFVIIFGCCNKWKVFCFWCEGLFGSEGNDLII